ncbi:MAG: hypothetical protein ABJO29_11130 [Yoonia sp.]|uniref:hypothetical protein n=1 Tax=Rhodobacterales TaxID=204455 RepID=UPI001FF5D4E0|nr:hypothetical protein [Loktanella sp. F6476L]MCK0119073.1 hypothetical protein [Loktanella sp. F6476L]
MGVLTGALCNVSAFDAPMLPKNAATAMNAATMKVLVPNAIGLSCSALLVPDRSISSTCLSMA